MPRLVNLVPAYRFHRASGKAVVTIEGKDHYLGLWKSKASRIEYDRIIAEWLANSRRLPTQTADLTIGELIAAYWSHAKTYYRKPDGTPTGEQNCLRLAMRALKQLYRDTRASDFGPLRLEAVRAKMIEYGWVRNQINNHVDRIRRMFRWGASKQMLPVSIYESLRTLAALSQGRCDAVESEPVRPVSIEHVEATIRQLSPTVAAMVRVQLLTGMRPGELCQMRGADIDQNGEAWTYRPASHKNQHRGHNRVVMLGPVSK